MNQITKGILIALLTAVISGVSVFLNKFAVQFWSDSSVFTTAKNLSLALLLTAGIFIFKKTKFSSLTRNEWLKLVLIGLIGGSIPFLLFFKGLTMASTANAAIINKTMFIWVALLALPFLKERLSKIQLLALVILAASVLMADIPIKFSFGKGELLILAATLFWAVETILIKKLAPEISFTTAAWARMFFGSIIMAGFLFFTGKLGNIIPTNGNQIYWLVVTVAALAGYVLTFYAALKLAPASIVASILVIAAPITIFLNSSMTNTAFPARSLPSIIIAFLGLIILVLPSFIKPLDIKLLKN